MTGSANVWVGRPVAVRVMKALQRHEKRRWNVRFADAGTPLGRADSPGPLKTIVFPIRIGSGTRAQN